MKNQKRLRDYGIKIGELDCGQLNSITDVKGVRVGHSTIANNEVQTGVTAVIPSEGNIFKEKLMAACHVINGFGKTVGTVQIDELGTLETPILLTNTLSVGIVEDALVEFMLGKNADIGVATGTVNPVVCECNDGYLNDIRGRHVKKENVFEALNNASLEFEEGSTGAGRGMSCFGLKGGIGTASRVIQLDNEIYTLGTLVLSNFGRNRDLVIDGFKAGQLIDFQSKKIIEEVREKGSIIVVMAMDIPCSERQLKRIARRAAVGIGRTGGYSGNGSGEIVIAFSTSNKLSHYNEKDIIDFKMIHENSIDMVFRAAAESVEEAILNSMICSENTRGRDGNIRTSLKEYIDVLNMK